MTRTPDETKKDLSDRIPVHFHPGDLEPRLTPLMMVDLEELHADALALIQQIQDENAEKDARIQQLEAERTELLDLLEQFGQCVVCEHTDKGTNESPCCDCWLCNGDAKCSNWQWRGVQKEE